MSFGVLILYPAALLVLTVLCVCVCVESLALSIYEIMLSANKDIFTSSFPV